MFVLYLKRDGLLTVLTWYSITYMYIFMFYRDYVELSYRHDTYSDEIKKLSVEYCSQPSRCTLSEFEK